MIRLRISGPEESLREFNGLGRPTTEKLPNFRKLSHPARSTVNAKRSRPLSFLG
jgi:hypothetical protein